MNRLQQWIKTVVASSPRSNAPSDLYPALLDRKRYDRVFQVLDRRVLGDWRFAGIFAQHEEMDLRWVLQNRHRVIRWIRGQVRRREYQVSCARESLCRIGEKERKLYRLEWPDRILQTVLAQALSECWESYFHSRLFSYRKGRSAVQAARLAARFVRVQSPRPVYVLKRDVKSYGDRIPHEKLFELLENSLPGADPFIRDLIHQFIAFPYRDSLGVDHLKNTGLPTGMPLNCVLENLYLTPLDEVLGSEPNASYMRYGDDIWISSPSLETARRMHEQLDAQADELHVVWHPEKSYDYCLAPESSDGKEDTEFLPVPRILHLGVAIDQNGHIDIPPEKLRLWRKELKVVLRRANHIARRLGLNQEGRVRHVVHFANQFMNSVGGRFPKMDYLLTVVTHDSRFIEIDRWVAQTVLAACYGRFSKANFRKTPFRVLKQYGLNSLYLRRQEMYAKARRKQVARC